jgi:hypothetical protein
LRYVVLEGVEIVECGDDVVEELVVGVCSIGLRGERFVN